MPIGELHTPILVKQPDGLGVTFETCYIGEVSGKMILEDKDRMEKAVEAVRQYNQQYNHTIIKIKEIVPNKVYEYKFAGGDIQKTVCSESDQFSMEDSITIAYAKHFMGGSGIYNRAVEKTMKLFSNQKAAEEKAKKEAEAVKTRREKKEKKRKERAARKREAEIELQAEAYRRAMQSMASEKMKEE